MVMWVDAVWVCLSLGDVSWWVCLSSGGVSWWVCLSSGGVSWWVCLSSGDVPWWVCLSSGGVLCMVLCKGGLYRRSGNFHAGKFSCFKFLHVLFLPAGKVAKEF